MNFEISNHSQIWQAPRQHRCRGACQIFRVISLFYPILWVKTLHHLMVKTLPISESRPSLTWDSTAHFSSHSILKGELDQPSTSFRPVTAMSSHTIKYIMLFTFILKWSHAHHMLDFFLKKRKESKHHHLSIIIIFGAILHSLVQNQIW